MFKENDIIKFRKSVTWRKNNNGNLLLYQPDFSIVREFVVDKKTIELFKLLKKQGMSFKQLCSVFGIRKKTSKENLFELLTKLFDYQIVENCTHLMSSIPNYFDKKILDRYSRELDFFSSYESDKMTRYGYLDMLFNSHVLIMGLGGIGSPIFEGLIRAGVKKLTVVDYDKVELSNLTRQTLYSSEDINKYKVDIAISKAKNIDSSVYIRAFKKKILKESDLCKICDDVNLILICCDEPSMDQVADLVSDYCNKNNITYIIGGGKNIN